MGRGAVFWGYLSIKLKIGSEAKVDEVRDSEYFSLSVICYVGCVVCCIVVAQLIILLVLDLWM